MGRREGGDRAPRQLGGNEAVAAPHGGRSLAYRAAQPVLLLAVGQIAPHQARGGLDWQAFEPGVVLEGGRGMLGLGYHHLADQVRALKNVVLQPAGEDARLHPRKGDL